ncbi:MAG TPA: thiamine pyrophosphate-dependent enzyme, partial [Ktedonobacteraceae bacterium]|nr:thiamine pyrophosphate-dependent enzyme [Ktedonobacteraceae bacterium]
WKLPIVYVCENNMYNEYTHYSETTAGEMSARPKAFDIHTEEVDGQNIREVYSTAQRLVERARRGEGPAFMLCNTYRYHGHHVGDIQRSYYRSKEEEQLWMTQRDPLQILASWLIDQHLADQATLEQISDRVRSEVEAGVEFALQAPFPELSEVDQDVYA